MAVSNGLYKFLGWSDNDSNPVFAGMKTSGTFTMPGRNVTLTANWDEPRTYVEVDMVSASPINVVQLDVRDIGMDGVTPGKAYVDFGDGQIQEVSPGIAQIISHNYATAGVHRVKIYDYDDSIEWLGFRNTRNYEDYGAVGFPVKYVYRMRTKRGCGGGWSNPFNDTFALCGKTDNSFLGFPDVDNFYIEFPNMLDADKVAWNDDLWLGGLFAFSSLPAVPPKLFWDVSHSRKLFSNRLCYHCENITKIPRKFYSNCLPFVVAESFQGTNVTLLPNDIFNTVSPNKKGNTPTQRGLVNANRFLHLCDTLVTVEPGVFDGICSLGMANFGNWTAWGSPGQNIKGGVTLMGFFYWNINLPSVPAGLFNNIFTEKWTAAKNGVGMEQECFVSLQGVFCRCRSLAMDVNTIFNRTVAEGGYPEVMWLGNAYNDKFVNSQSFTPMHSGIFSASQYGLWYRHPEYAGTSQEWKFSSQLDPMQVYGDITSPTGFIAKFPNVVVPSNSNWAFNPGVANTDAGEPTLVFPLQAALNNNNPNAVPTSWIHYGYTYPGSSPF